MVKKFLVLLLVLIVSVPLFSQVTMYGGRGLMRVVSANVITPTDIYVSGYFSTYFEKTGPEQLAKFYTYYLNATFGLSRNFEVSCYFIPYQDDQYHIWGRIGDSGIALKYMVPFSTTRFQMGMLGFFKFPTAEIPNVPYEIFSTDKAGWGGKALFTLDLSNIIGQFPFKLYTNAGYYDQDVTDTYFSSEIDQMLIGAGIKFPIRSTQVYLEYTGEIFINSLDTVSYDENFTRVTAGVRFLGPWGFTIDVVNDFSLAKRTKLTGTDRLHKEYSKWRFWVGLNYRFSLYKYFDKSAKLARKKREQEKRKLERIKSKRKKATKEIERMKELLKKKNPEQN